MLFYKARLDILKPCRKATPTPAQVSVDSVIMGVAVFLRGLGCWRAQGFWPFRFRQPKSKFSL